MTHPARADVPVVYEITSDPRVVKHNPSGRLGSLAEAEALVKHWMNYWQQFGFGYWCVREAERSKVIGFCGIKVVKFQDAEGLNLLYRFAQTV